MSLPYRPAEGGPPPKHTGVRPSRERNLFLRATRSQPGVWLVYVPENDKSKLPAIVKYLRKMAAERPSDDYEIMVRQGQIYARFLKD